MSDAPVEQICTVRIELLDSSPLIWREVEVPTAVTIRLLHGIVQAAMDWDDSHLWEFRPATPRTAPKISASRRLEELLAPRRTRLIYTYDFGDSWDHLLTITRVRPGDAGVGYPRYVAGEQAAPPEDCGGIYGFYAKLEALADPSHPEHADIKDWLGDYDPAALDERRLQFALAAIAKRRRAGRVRHAEPAA